MVKDGQEARMVRGQGRSGVKEGQGSGIVRDQRWPGVKDEVKTR